MSAVSSSPCRKRQEEISGLSPPLNNRAVQADPQHSQAPSRHCSEQQCLERARVSEQPPGKPGIAWYSCCTPTALAQQPAISHSCFLRAGPWGTHQLWASPLGPASASGPPHLEEAALGPTEGSSSMGTGLGHTVWGCTPRPSTAQTPLPSWHPLRSDSAEDHPIVQVLFCWVLFCGVVFVFLRQVLTL